MPTVNVKYDVLEDLANELRDTYYPAVATSDYLRKLLQGGFTGVEGDQFRADLKKIFLLMGGIERAEQEAARRVQLTIEEMQQADQDLIGSMPY